MSAVPIKDIVALVGGRYEGPTDRLIRGVATLKDAAPDQLAFLGNQFYVPQLAESHAGQFSFRRIWKPAIRGSSVWPSLMRRSPRCSIASSILDEIRTASRRTRTSRR